MVKKSDQNELLPQRRGRLTVGNVNQRSNNQQLVRRYIYSNDVELLPTRRVRQNMPHFEPGSGNFDRRGPIPVLDSESLRRRWNERSFRYVLVPRRGFDGGVVSDDESDEEEREYLPTKRSG